MTDPAAEGPQALARSDLAAGDPPALAPGQPPPPPGPVGGPHPRFDGTFVGPLLPPPGSGPGSGRGGAVAAPISDDVLALLTVGPVVMLGGLALSLEVPLFEPGAGSSLDAPIAVAALLALAGYLVAGVESRAIATAVIGGRVEGRPLRLRASISLARRRFLKVLGASVIVGFTAGLLGIAIQVPIGIALGNVEEINYGLSLLIGTLVAAPFAYVTAGIVLGEVGVFEAITRSFRLARARKRLALVVALFGVLSQFIVLFGISIGGDVVLRILDGTGIGEVFPAALAIPVAAALAFAFGTLLFLVEAITAAPAVYAFVALTHYTHGLQAGRDAPAGGTRVWDPWLTPGLAIAALVGFLALIAAVTDLPA